MIGTTPNDKSKAEESNSVSTNGEIGTKLEIKEGEDEQQAMMRLMGFGGFSTSHGKKIETNHKGAQKGAAKTKSKRKFRQFMNRKVGGVIQGD